MGVVLFLAATVVACGSSPSGGGAGGGGSGGAGGGSGGTAGSASGGAGSAGGAGGGATGTAGNPGCGTATGTGSGEACHGIDAVGPCVTGTFSTAAPPTPAGGAFAFGAYNLVSQTFYGPADAGLTFLPGAPFQQTYNVWDVSSSSFTLDQTWRSGTVEARSRETAAVSGMIASFTQICPAADAGIDWGGSAQFTATSSSITLFWQRTNGITEVTVYDKVSP